jgi:hypothetical protein
MENKQATTEPHFDPQSDLELLNRARSAVDVDHVLDFGPWWYAPLLTNCLAGATLFGRLGTTTSFILGGIGLLSGLVVAGHDFGRRTIRPKFSFRSTAMLAIIVLIVFVILGLWGTAVSSIGAERFLPWYAIAGWLLTAALFLGIRAVSHWLRSRRTVLS